MTDLYKKFYTELKEKYGKEKKDIINWTYIGWFSTTKARTGFDAGEGDHQGERFFDAIMENTKLKIKDFYCGVEDKCVCQVNIIWNHIIVKDPYAEDIEYMMLGSECIDNFTGIDRNRKCSICKTKINNSVSGKCKDCKKIRFCDKCNKQLPKGKHGTFCSNTCMAPNQYCSVDGCENPKYKTYMKTCPECFYNE